MVVPRSLMSYCSVIMISHTMWVVKDVRHRCDGSATGSLGEPDSVRGGPASTTAADKDPAQAELGRGTLMRKVAAMRRATRPVQVFFGGCALYPSTMSLRRPSQPYMSDQ